jgi:hypothetical protein
MPFSRGICSFLKGILPGMPWKEGEICELSAEDFLGGRRKAEGGGTVGFGYQILKNAWLGAGAGDQRSRDGVVVVGHWSSLEDGGLGKLESEPRGPVWYGVLKWTYIYHRGGSFAREFFLFCCKGLRGKEIIFYFSRRV